MKPGPMTRLLYISPKNLFLYLFTSIKKSFVSFLICKRAFYELFNNPLKVTFNIIYDLKDFLTIFLSISLLVTLKYLIFFTFIIVQSF